MTELAFHFNVADKSGYLCRLLRKAANQGSRVAVVGDEVFQQQLSLALWTFSALDFVPHCNDLCDAAMLAASPIVFCKTAGGSPHQQVLLNIGLDVPAGFESFERLIEVVGTDDADRANSRRRWKYYLDRGYAISRHDLASKDLH